MFDVFAPLALIFIVTAIAIAGFAFLIQALVKTELQVAKERFENKQLALLKQDDEYMAMKKKHNLLIAKIAELEGSRQDLFNYLVKQEKMMEESRTAHHHSVVEQASRAEQQAQNNGTPQV